MTKSKYPTKFDFIMSEDVQPASAAIANRDGERMGSLTRALVKAHIQDADRVFVAPDHQYRPQTEEHRQIWGKLVKAIGPKGAWYSTLRAQTGGNTEYVAYLIGQIGALRRPALEERLRLPCG